MVEPLITAIAESTGHALSNLFSWVLRLDHIRNVDLPRCNAIGDAELSGGGGHKNRLRNIRAKAGRTAPSDDREKNEDPGSAVHA
jgi:hypothetical protein